MYLSAETGNAGVSIQLDFLESVMDLLAFTPAFIIGITIIGILLLLISQKAVVIPKVKIFVASFVMYYYLCLMMGKIVGIPTFREFIRLRELGEHFFNPNINLIPLIDGLNVSFILNIFLFIPLGFMCPIISPKFEQARNTISAGFGLSLFIEISQLFTLYRATDIDDLITNLIGTVTGYLCFKLAAKLHFVKLHSCMQSKEKDVTGYIPVFIIVIAVVANFFS